MNEEVWKDIPNFEGLYQISNYGRIKSLPKKAGKSSREARILGEHLDRYGYVTCYLSKNGKVHAKRAHSLVMETFSSNPNNLPQINHKDGNKRNNHISNLEFCDDRYNKRYGWQHGQYKSNSGKKKYDSIVQLNLKREVISSASSVSAMSKQTGISSRLIYKCLRGVFKTTHGYIFESTIIKL